MKVYEVKKGDASYNRGRVMMAIEGVEADVNVIEAKLIDADFDSTNCADEGDKDGELVIFFIVDRWDIKDFRAAFKKFKAEV